MAQQAGDLGGWVPQGVTQMELSPPERLVGRGKPDSEDFVESTRQLRLRRLENFTQTAAADGHEKDLRDGLLALNAHGADITDVLKRSLEKAIETPFFCPQVIATLEEFGATAGLDGDGDISLFHLWADSTEKSWDYALTRLKSQKSPHVDKMIEIFMESSAKGNFYHESKSMEKIDRLEVLWGHGPEVVQSYVHKNRKNVCLAGVFRYALQKRNEPLIELILNTEKMGSPATVRTFLIQYNQNIYYDDMVWISDVLKKHPLCNKTWQLSVPVSYSVSKWIQVEPKYLGREVKSHYSTPLTGKTGVVGMTILADNTRMIQDLAHTPSGRQALVDAVLEDNNVLLMFLLEKKTHGIDETHILQWGGEQASQWRDGHGCCLAHYAVAALQHTSAVDRTLTRMINLVPEWRHVVRNDGVALLSLFSDPEAQARASRKEMKEVTREARGEKAATSSLPRRRM